jgi:hypothetical protein
MLPLTRFSPLRSLSTTVGECSPPNRRSGFSSLLTNDGGAKFASIATSLLLFCGLIRAKSLKIREVM